MASSGSQGLSRRKPSSSSSSSASASKTPGSTRIVYRESFRPSESELPIWQRNWFIALLFLMALGFFGLALFLFLTLDSDINPSASASASAASSEGVEVPFFFFSFFILNFVVWRNEIATRVRDLVNLDFGQVMTWPLLDLWGSYRCRLLTGRL